MRDTWCRLERVGYGESPWEEIEIGTEYDVPKKLIIPSLGRFWFALIAG